MRMNQWLLGGATVFSSLMVAAMLGGCPATSIIGGNTGGNNSGNGTGGGTGLTFNLLPTAQITVDQTVGVVPLTVHFDSSGSTDDGIIVAREWDFGDGGTSQEIAPAHTFNSSGTFTVTLTITDNQGGKGTRTVKISTSAAPVAVISADRTVAGSPPAVINFSAAQSFDSDGTIVKYLWNFGDNTSEPIAEVAHTYSAPGTYTVQLTVTDNVGVIGVSKVIVQIGIPTPAIGFQAPGQDRKNLVVSDDTPLWAQAIFSSTPGVPRFITAGLDGDLDICDAQTVLYDRASGEKKLTIFGHFDRINSAQLSEDGTLVISAGDDNMIRVFDATTGSPVSSFSTETRPTAVAFSPDARSFVYGMSNGKVIWQDRISGAKWREFTQHSGQVNSIAFDPLGVTAFSGASDRHAILWDIINGVVLRDYVHATAVDSVAYDLGDNTQVATGSDDAKIQLWSVTGGGLLNTLTGHGDAVTALTYSADGALLISGSRDQSARAWNPQTGAAVRTYSGASTTIYSVALSHDAAHMVAGSADGSARIYATSTGTLEETLKPCASPIVSVQFNHAGDEVMLAVGSRNSIQLDSNPSQGNDLDITQPVALSLKNVPSLDQLNVSTGRYFLWSQIDTTVTDPVRSYAYPVINVIPPYTASISADTPVVPLVDDEADIIFAPINSRQVCDLGSLAHDDRIYIAFFETPSYSESYTSIKSYSVALLDGDSNIFAWFESGFVPISADTKLVIGHSSSHNYLVVDGGLGVSIKIVRASGQYATRKQTVLIDFNAAPSVQVGPLNALSLKALNAADFNQFFAVSPGFTDSDTAQLEQTILSKMRAIYTGYGIDFVGSNELANGTATLSPPYMTMHVCGSYAPFLGLLGISDYLDARNDIAVGTGITFGLEFGLVIDQNGVLNGVQFPVETIPQLGATIGTTAAHECGHMLGLRHTNDASDLMQGGGDPTTSRSLKAAPVTTSEQIYGQPSIGIQDAPTILSEVLGAP